VLTPEEAWGYEIQMTPAPADGQQVEITYQTEPGIIKSHYVRIYGTVTSDGNPLCTMVLINGQKMFSCKDHFGEFDLEVPLGENGKITLYCFCGGFAPYKEVFYMP
jgi:hypothetical protein